MPDAAAVAAVTDYDRQVRTAKANLSQSQRVAEAAALVKAHADAEVAAARQALWALGIFPENV